MIDKPVTVTTVRNVLGVGSTDVGTLCTHANVRQWSRFKPMDMPGLSQDKRDTDTYLSQSNFWKGKQNIDYIPVASYGTGSYLYKIQTCGLNFYAFTKWLDCLDTWLVTEQDAETEISDNFSWDKPKGGANSPYRLGDFIGYDNTIGCQFWSSITNDPNIPYRDLPKYNYSARTPIDCSVMTYGGNGISLLELLQTIGATSISLRAVIYNTDMEYLFPEKASFGSPIDNTSAFLSVTPPSAYCADGSWFGIAYFVEFTASIANVPTTLYMPITQRVDGGENTKVMITGDGKTRYGLQRFLCTGAEPATFNLVQLNALRSNGSWTNWLSTKDVSTANISTNNIWLHFEAKAAVSTPYFRFTTKCVSIDFQYMDSSGKVGTYTLDGSVLSDTRIRITNSGAQSDWQTSKGYVDVQPNSTQDVYLALPSTFEGVPNGSKIIYMVVWWKAGESAEPKRLSTFNLNLTVS